MTSDAGRRAAWDAYLALAKGLLPSLREGDSDDVVNPRLGAVVLRIRRYAPMWPADGPMLIAAASSAVRLLRQGDREALAGLSTAMAHRLLRLSGGPHQRYRPSPGNRTAAGGTPSGTERLPGADGGRDIPQRGQQHENGFPDDRSGHGA